MVERDIANESIARQLGGAGSLVITERGGRDVHHCEVPAEVPASGEAGPEEVGRAATVGKRRNAGLVNRCRLATISASCNPAAADPIACGSSLGVPGRPARPPECDDGAKGAAGAVRAGPAASSAWDEGAVADE